MANFLTKLFNSNNRGISNSGSGGALVSQANLDRLDPGNIMRAYDAATEAGNIQQLADIPIPKINAPYPATDKEAIDSQQAAIVFKDGIKNFKTVLKSAGQMEKSSAEAVEAMSDYMIERREAEEKKQQANVKNAKHAAKSGLNHQQMAVDLLAERKRREYEIQQTIETYQKVSGW